MGTPQNGGGIRGAQERFDVSWREAANPAACFAKIPLPWVLSAGAVHSAVTGTSCLKRSPGMAEAWAAFGTFVSHKGPLLTFFMAPLSRESKLNRPTWGC